MSKEHDSLEVSTINVEKIAENFDILVYDVSDFEPRGALRENTRPPYPLSKVPNDLNSSKSVLSYMYNQPVLQSTYDQLIRFADYNAGSRETWDLSQRLNPENISERLNLELINQMRLKKARQDGSGVNGNIYPATGEKVALVHVKTRPMFLFIVDMKSGTLHPLNKFDEVPKKSYHIPMLERFKPPPEAPFENLDMNVENTKSSKDLGRNKTYTESTLSFHEWMTLSDVEAEDVLFNEINNLVPITRAIQRFSLRVGRERIREVLADLRHGKWEENETFFKELRQEMTYWNFSQRTNYLLMTVHNSASSEKQDLGEYSGKIEKLRKEYADLSLQLFSADLKAQVKIVHELEDINAKIPQIFLYWEKLTQVPTLEEIKKHFTCLFSAESKYLDAVIRTPWNKDGSEPLDAFINVFWFRFDYKQLADQWNNRKDSSKMAVANYFHKAAVKRIKTWFMENYGGSYFDWTEYLDLKEDDEFNLTKEKLDKEVGPLKNFLDKDRLKKAISDEAKKERWSELTQLIWSSLKWTQPRQWKEDYALRLDRGDEHTHETTADPYWLERSDFKGRLVLPEEYIDGLITKLKLDFESGKISRQQVKNYLIKYFDGESVYHDKEQLQGLLSSITTEAKGKKAYESIVEEFSRQITDIPFSRLIRAVMELEGKQRAVVLNRLGYDVPHELHTRGDSDHFDKNDIRFVARPGKIGNIIVITAILFNNKSDLYYETLSEATKNLSLKLGRI